MEQKETKDIPGTINEKDLFNDLKTKHNNYDDSVHCMQAILIYFDKNPGTIDEKGIALGRSLMTTMLSINREVTPDIISTYDNGDIGLLAEIKWSISENYQYMTKEIGDLQKYSDKLIGWKKIFPHLEKDEVNFHDLVLICHSDVCRKIKNCIEDIIKTDSKAYSYLKNDKFAVWSFAEEKNRNGEQVIRFRNEYGKINHVKLQDGSIDKIDILQKVVSPIRLRVIFTSDDPPDSYVIREVLTFIFYILSKARKDEMNISLEDINKMYNDWYPPLNKFSRSTVNKRLIKKACDMIIKFQYNLKKLDSEQVKIEGLDSNKTWYVATKKLPKGKLLDEWIIKKIIKLQKQEEERERKRDERKKKSQALKKKIDNGRYKQKNITEYLKADQNF